jgi:hypothetical protein
MTAQVPETLLIDGEKHALFTEPLEAYFKELGSRPDFQAPHTACWRGYVGQWELNDNKLYLRRLSGGLTDGKTVTLKSIFPKGPYPVFARWFTGVLIVPQGEMLEYIHMGYASIYEDELRLKIKRGVLVSKSRRNANPIGWLNPRLDILKRKLFSDF